MKRRGKIIYIYIYIYKTQHGRVSIKSAKVQSICPMVSERVRDSELKSFDMAKMEEIPNSLFLPFNLITESADQDL